MHVILTTNQNTEQNNPYPISKMPIYTNQSAANKSQKNKTSKFANG